MSGWLRDTEQWQTVPGTEQGFHKCYYLLSERQSAKAYTPHHYIYEKQMKKHMLESM